VVRGAVLRGRRAALSGVLPQHTGLRGACDLYERCFHVKLHLGIPTSLYCSARNPRKFLPRGSSEVKPRTSS
jgi:hypothetical protein